MKLFDYDSHAPQSAKRLSNPNVNAKLKIKGSSTDQFIKASLKFYCLNEAQGIEKSFIDSIDSSISNQKLKLLNGVLSEKTIDFNQIFTVTFNEKDWSCKDDEFILNSKFNEIEIYIKCNATSNDILETVFTKLMVKKL